VTAGEILAVAGAVATPLGAFITKLLFELRTERTGCDQRIKNVAERLEGRIAALEGARDAQIKEYVEKRIDDQKLASDRLAKVSEVSAAALDRVVDELVRRREKGSVDAA